MFFDLLLNKNLFHLTVALLRFDLNSSSLICVSPCYSTLTGFIWFFVTFIEFLLVTYREGIFKDWFITHGNYIPLLNNYSSKVDISKISFETLKQRTFSYPDALIFNYIDPDSIPELMKAYAETIFTLAQYIMHVHGFQVDNSRNQSEHLIMLLFNESSAHDKMVSSPALRIHKRLFSNYKKWCTRMGTRPILCKDLSPIKSHDLIIEDILIYLLIWGEAANLRHMPECICYIFHKTMEAHVLNKGKTSNPEGKYPGYFLDIVIIPIYEVVSKSMASSEDHASRKIYDDFNEFFWNPICLNYNIYGQGLFENNIEVGLSHYHDHEDVVVNNVHSALNEGSKTYLEKRSWFHPLYAMNRLFEWHAITFTILATWAFSNLLKWTFVFTFQVASFIFWEMSVFALLWTGLEIWTQFPDVKIPDSALYGYLIRVLSCYMVLVYQTIYFHWSFVPNEIETNLKDLEFYNKGDNIFWWWQYLWISIVASTFYLIQGLFSFFPSIGSSILTSKNELIKAVLSICYPMSQNFLGKSTHVPQQEVNYYILYWLTLLAFKLWFGYQYVVSPVATPTLELYDDYMNYNQISFMKVAGLISVWWLPHFLVYIIDLSIWYAVWSSAVGGFIALGDRLGAVRNSSSFRSHFMKAPFLFSSKCMPNFAPVEQKEIPISHLHSVNYTPIVNKDAGKTLHSDRLIELNVKSKSSTDLESYLYEGYQCSANEPEIKTESKSAIEHPMERLTSTAGPHHRSRDWLIFAKVWNQVVHKLRDRDYLNNREKEILLFTEFDWLSKPIYLPLYQTVGCVESAALLYKDISSEYESENEKHLKIKIAEKFCASLDVTMSEAVSEAWELFTWIGTELLGNVHREDLHLIFSTFSEWGKSRSLFCRLSGHLLKKVLTYASQIVSALKSALPKRKQSPVVPRDMYVAPSHHPESSQEAAGSNIKKSLSTGFLTALGNEANKKFNLQPFRKDIELTDNIRDKLREDFRSLFNAIKTSLKLGAQFDPVAQNIISKLTYISTLQSGFFVSDIYASRTIDFFCSDHRSCRALSKLEDLLTLRITTVELKSHEANRRLNFLINSLFMDIPKVPGTRYCKEYTCVTPYYSEDILLTKEDLLAMNSDKVSVILYLQTLYKHDWANFLERKKIDESDIWSPSHIQDLRMWASLRAQTLFRTVEGMMYTESAIRLLAELEDLSADNVDLLCKLKFNYVVACQVYGVFKKNMDKKAVDIEFLLSRYPNLRVAYIDNCKISSSESAFYSVLIKYEPPHNTELPEDKRHSKDRIREVFRIKLPGNPILGEGKPENQNHAIIFTRGRYLQAIDMNQDGYFEEALKMRNLLEEFSKGCAILGFREHIFTGSVSSVANYMALQELSFVTLGQRVLNRPLRIRQHYGHPDLFDKLFVMTEGGMSKASKGINLSEDVFAGFNATIRGHPIQFVEYVQVGKGRDVGLQQTYKFEAKLAQGNAEQSLSRDVSRLGNRLDFFRLLSFYYGGIGHYLSNTLIMFTLVVVVYSMLLLAIFKEEGVNNRPIHPEGVFQMLLAGMGILQTLPLAVTLTVEKGLYKALSEISFMILSGGPLYFIFHIQTKSYYFSQTLLAGGAMYRPTGRGFVTRHSFFDENFRFFASSHIYLGYELIVALVLLAFFTKSKQYFGLTWSLWMTAVSFILGPFWFNPLSFEANRIQDDYQAWVSWMKETNGDSNQSWEVWWKEENFFYSKLSFTWKIFLIIQKSFLWIVLAYGILESQNFFHRHTDQSNVLKIALVLFLGLVLQNFINKYFRHERDFNYPIRRFLTLILSGFVLFYITTVYIHRIRYILHTIALYYLMSAICFVFLVLGVNHSYLMQFYRIHDYIVGHSIFLLLTVASAFQVGYLQTWLLYHNALSRGVEIEDILRYARRSKEKADTENEVISELKNKLTAQEKKIQELIELQSKSSAASHHNNSLAPNSHYKPENIPLFTKSEDYGIHGQTYTQQQQPNPLNSSLQVKQSLFYKR